MSDGNEVIVIGGGPAGLMAAGQAALSGARVILLEKMPQPARKLLISGKGRCNLTNACSLDEFLGHFGPARNFLKPAFHTFFVVDLLSFLSNLGIETVTERGNRIFPASGKAGEVVTALLNWVKACGVKIYPNQRVIRLVCENNEIKGIEVQDLSRTPPRKVIYSASAVILATGGASYPGTGSTGDGYRLAQEVGHTIIPVRPALTPLVVAGEVAARLQGLSLKNVRAEIWSNNKKVAQEFGEMLFTHFGLSGPIILSLSKFAVDALNQKQSVMVKLDLKPALDDATLDQRLIREFDAHSKMQLRKILKNLLPQRLIPICLEQTSIDPLKIGSQITANERKAIRQWLKNFSFQITGYRPFIEAIITAGGINLSEVNRQNMASKIVRGLYFAGEVLDIDADTGGFNLQAAFSTGYLAGKSVARVIGR